jgi:hypothetical protein
VSNRLHTCEAIAADSVRYLFSQALRTLTSATGYDDRHHAALIIGGHLDSLMESESISMDTWRAATAEVNAFVWGPSA